MEGDRSQTAVGGGERRGKEVERDEDLFKKLYYEGQELGGI